MYAEGRAPPTREDCGEVVTSYNRIGWKHEDETFDGTGRENRDLRERLVTSGPRNDWFDCCDGIHRGTRI